MYCRLPEGIVCVNDQQMVAHQLARMGYRVLYWGRTEESWGRNTWRTERQSRIVASSVTCVGPDGRQVTFTMR